jgi:hypothetical protein
MLTAFCRNDPVNNTDPLGLEGFLTGKYNPFTWIRRAGQGIDQVTDRIPVVNSVGDLLGGAVETVGQVGEVDICAVATPVRAVGSSVDDLGASVTATYIPLVKQVGRTVSDIGLFVEGVGEVGDAGLRLSGTDTKVALKKTAKECLDIVGLGEAIMGEQFAPNRTHGNPAAGRITGTLSLPRVYAEAIREADREWQTYSVEIQRDDMERGMKRWHMRSNTKLAADRSITELPWFWMGGVIHEIEPGGVSAEVQAQGVLGNLIDAPGDIVANTFGLLGGLVLPASWLESYTRVVGGLIPGHYNPWVGLGVPTTSGVKAPSVVFP